MRGKWPIVIVAVCLVVTVAAIAYAAGKTSAPEVVRAQRFEVVDFAGRGRAELGVRQDGAVELWLRDEDGHGAVQLAVTQSRDAAVLLWGRDGHLRGGLTSAGSGEDLSLDLFTQSAKGGASLSLMPDGSPRLALSDKGGRERVFLGLGDDGTPLLQIEDERGAARAKLTLVQGRPGLVLLDADGRGRAGMNMLTESGGAAFSLLDKDGKVLWEAP